MVRLILRFELESVIRLGAATRPHRGHGEGRDDAERDTHREENHGDRDQRAALDSAQPRGR